MRKNLDYSQENLALEMGVTAEAYGKIELRKTHINEERLEQISKIFGFEPWKMLRSSADELILLLIDRKLPSSGQ